MAKTRPEDLPAGVRRLKEIIRAPVLYYPNQAAAERAWSRIVQKFHYTLEQARSAVKITYEPYAGGQIGPFTIEPAVYIKARIHPGCPHWRRFLEDDGIQCEMGTSEEEWPRQPPRTREELDAMIKGTGGRYLP